MSDTIITAGCTFVEVEYTGDRTLLEIPNTAFADATNPTIAEVRIWIDANLTAGQKTDSELYMVEQAADYVPLSYTEGVFEWEFTDSLNNEYQTVTINGDVTAMVVETHDGAGVTFNEIATTGVLVPILEAAGFFNVTLDFTDFALGGNATSIFRYTLTEGDLDLEISFQSAEGSETSSVGATFVAPTFTTLGSTSNEPDYVWNIINDNLIELHRRENHGDIYYLNAGLPHSRRHLAQKGNPNRPFKTVPDLVDNVTFLDNDTVIVESGSYTDLATFTKGNVTYILKAGAILENVNFEINSEVLTILGEGELRKPNLKLIQIDGDCGDSIVNALVLQGSWGTGFSDSWDSGTITFNVGTWDSWDGVGLLYKASPGAAALKVINYNIGNFDGYVPAIVNGDNYQINLNIDRWVRSTSSISIIISNTGGSNLKIQGRVNYLEIDSFSGTVDVGQILQMERGVDDNIDIDIEINQLYIHDSIAQSPLIHSKSIGNTSYSNFKLRFIVHNLIDSDGVIFTNKAGSGFIGTSELIFEINGNSSNALIRDESSVAIIENGLIIQNSNFSTTSPNVVYAAANRGNSYLKIIDSNLTSLDEVIETYDDLTIYNTMLISTNGVDPVLNNHGSNITLTNHNVAANFALQLNVVSAGGTVTVHSGFN